MIVTGRARGIGDDATTAAHHHLWHAGELYLRIVYGETDVGDQRHLESNEREILKNLRDTLARQRSA